MGDSENSGNQTLKLTDTGVHISDGLFRITIPWTQLDRDQPLDREYNGTLFRLLDVRPGRGFLIDHSRFTTDDEALSSSVRLQEEGLWVDLALDDERASQIRQRREEFFRRVESHLLRELPSGAAILSVDSEHQTLDFDPRVSLLFPSFCPVSGDSCTSLAWLPCASNSWIPWLLSGSGRRRLEFSPWVRRGVAVCSVLLFWGLGFAMREPGGLQANYTQITLLSTLFLINPFAGWLMRTGLELQEIDAGRVRARIRDPEYFSSFVELNR